MARTPRSPRICFRCLLPIDGRTYFSEAGKGDRHLACKTRRWPLSLTTDELKVVLQGLESVAWAALPPDNPERLAAEAVTRMIQHWLTPFSKKPKGGAR